MEQLNKNQYDILFIALDKMKAFDIRNGSVTLHFDSLGRIKTIEKKESFRIVE